MTKNKATDKEAKRAAALRDNLKKRKMASKEKAKEEKEQK